MDIEIRILGAGSADVLARLAPDVFDHGIDPRWCAEFLADPRHHLAVAIDAGTVVRMASAVHYVHPDKRPELWINEVGVAATHRERGIGKRLLQALFVCARALGCAEAWVLTDDENTAARRLYAAAGGAESRQVMVSFNLLPAAIDGP